MIARAVTAIALCALLGACQRRPEAPQTGAPLGNAPMTAKIRTYEKHPMYRIIETPPESPYEAALDYSLHVSLGPDAMQQICAQWFPEYGARVADAFLGWRSKNQPVLDELKARSTEVWNRRAGPDVAYVKMVYPHIRKQIVDELMRQSDAVSVDEFRTTCARYPDTTVAPEWNLEKRLRQQLRVVRQRPQTKASDAIS